MSQFNFLKPVLIALLFLSDSAKAQTALKIGAYYFDGWTGKTYHITDKLKNDFPEREPIWGWVTSTPEIIEKQIDVAQSVGIKFFSFCWYYNPNTKGKNVSGDFKNNALNLYLKASNKKKLDFTLFIANNGGYAVKPEEWPQLCAYWIGLFKDESYIQVDDKPLITFFDMPSLVNSFGTAAKVNEALETFRNLAKKQGFKGISIAANSSAKSTSIKMAKDCGFDILTGYNYASYGLASSKDEVVPIDSMRATERNIWNTMSSQWDKPVIPVITLGWDKRPWVTDGSKSARFSGMGKQSVDKSVNACKEWMEQNESHVVKEHLAIMYAWNEYGEGAYLTPSKEGSSIVDGVKKALLYQLPNAVEP